MAAAITSIGNGSGFIYVTKADGTTILANIENNKVGAASAFAMGQAEFKVTGASSLDFKRFFLNTSGSEGSVSGADEITEHLRRDDENIRANSTISSGTANYLRQGPLMGLNITEEGAADDTLENIVPKDNAGGSGDENNYYDGDIVIIRKAAASNNLTIADTGNIKLDNDADFVMSNQHTDSIVLQYSTGNLKWNEISRQPNAGYSITKLRAADVPLDIAGVEKITYTGSQTGLASITSGTDENVIVVTSSGTKTAAADFTIPAPSGSPITGERFVCYFNAQVTKGSFTFTIFGETLTAEELASGSVYIETVYDGAAWQAVKASSVTGSDSVVTTMIKDANITTAKVADKAITAEKLADGILGDYLLDYNTSSNSTSTTGSYTTIATIEVPANTLGAGNVQKLHVCAFGQIGSGTGTNTVRLKYGGTVISTLALSSAASRSGAFKIEADIVRVSSSSQKVISLFHTADEAISDIEYTATSISETAAQDILVEVNQADASHVTVQAFYVSTTS
jgi:hypothetical protein